MHELKLGPHLDSGEDQAAGLSLPLFLACFFPSTQQTPNRVRALRMDGDRVLREGRNGCARTVLSIRQEFAEGLTNDSPQCGRTPGHPPHSHDPRIRPAIRTTISSPTMSLQRLSTRAPIRSLLRVRVRGATKMLDGFGISHTSKGGFGMHPWKFYVCLTARGLRQTAP
jgi:hypothetical protein